LEALILHEIPPPHQSSPKFDSVIMLNTYRGWDQAKLKEGEIDLPELADKYFTENARFTFLTMTKSQINHFRRIGFFVKILGYGEWDSLLVVINTEKQYKHLINNVQLEYKILRLKYKTYVVIDKLKAYVKSNTKK
jgi:hypothetical protein